MGKRRGWEEKGGEGDKRKEEEGREGRGEENRKRRRIGREREDIIIYNI